MQTVTLTVLCVVAVLGLALADFDFEDSYGFGYGHGMGQGYGYGPVAAKSDDGLFSGFKGILMLILFVTLLQNNLFNFSLFGGDSSSSSGVNVIQV